MKPDDKTVLLERKIRFLERQKSQMEIANQKVEHELWQRELQLFEYHTHSANQRQEIDALYKRIKRIENATSLKLARKAKEQIDKVLTSFRPKRASSVKEPTYHFDANYRSLLRKADKLIKNDPALQKQLWLSQLPSKSKLVAYQKQLANRKKTIKFSILLPVFNIDMKWLYQAIQSVLEQLYQNWELCLVDDGSTNSPTLYTLRYFADSDSRIKVHYQKENRGISETSNQALAMSTGDFVTFLDHDDCLSPNALLEVYKAIDKEGADFVYSDEALVSPHNQIANIFCKPDFSPDFLLSVNYINHLMVIKKDLILRSGGFRKGVEGAQDYDVALKCSEIAAKIHHIPKILYFWRISGGTFSSTGVNKKRIHNAGRQAIEYALERRKTDATVYKAKRIYNYYVKRKIHPKPKVSIIIPFRDKFELLEQCLEAILFNTDYEAYEIIGINNNSERPETKGGMHSFVTWDPRISFVDFNGPFNYSKINNLGVMQATGDHIVLMNSDIEVISSNWLEALLEHSQRKEVGAVGGKLYYPNNTIQHAGVVLGIAGFAGHSHRHVPREADGSMNRLVTVHNVSAVTGALLMVKKDLYHEVGGLDEVHLKVALNDVDFCLKLREKGYLNVFTPYCEAYHHESTTRGYDTTLAQKRIFEKECNFFRQKWKRILEADPYYNENLTLEREDFSVKNADELPIRVKPICSPGNM